jgi:hypothetical protein
MDWKFIIPNAVAVIAIVAVFANRIWLKASIERSVQHGFDVRIEGWRAELRRSEEELKSGLRTQETEISTLREGVLSGRNQRQALLEKRRFDAIERVWQALVALGPYKSLSATMAVVDFDAWPEKPHKTRSCGRYL